MQKDAVEALYGPVLFGLIVWCVVSFWPGDGDRWTDRLWHSLCYSIAMEQVRIDAKPPDCDFWYAPVGQKRCRFKATVAAYNAGGVLVAGDNAPQYDRDAQSGKVIHWSAFFDQKPKSVLVTWTRTKD